MTAKAAPEVSLLTARVVVPQHVVFRSFPAEMVVLNLNTGKYHGLNPIGGQMLEQLQRTGSVYDAATALAECFDEPRGVIEQDLCELCEALHERGLIELDDALPL